ncbi:XisI protein [Nitrincola sp. A-D6]|uniref:XisI protein n=1 Tax=Nitrincola sp. A-D6 TaxID=1545442 RepID=UPI00118478C4|nr:XisI protein [Nitrincola sp. A-D6]
MLNIYTAQQRRDLKPVSSIEIRDGQVWIHQNRQDWGIEKSQPADSATAERLRSALLNTPG